MVFYRFWPMLTMDQLSRSMCVMYRIWTKSLLWDSAGGGDPDLGSASKSLRYPLKVVGRVRDRLQSQSRCMSACDSVLTFVIMLLLVQQEHLEVGRVLQNHSKQLILVDFEQTADFKARQIPQTTFNNKCQPTAVWFHVSTQHPRP